MSVAWRGAERTAIDARGAIVDVRRTNNPLRGAALVLLAISPFAYLACSDDTTGGGGTLTLPTDDASTTPTADAAPAVDAGVDAPDADAGPIATATVHVVTAKKVPEANVKVVFYDAAGGVLGTETTDATGQATHTMPAGGSVTGVFGTATASSLVTIEGVQPFLSSYATVRASAAALAPSRALHDGSGNPVAPALPVDGTLKVTAFSQDNAD